MVLTSKLVHFAYLEFIRPELVDDFAARALDCVREEYGKPLRITSDARSVAEELALPDHADPPESSLHVQGRAFDLRWSFADAQDVYKFVQAVYDVCHVLGVNAEIEPRPTGAQPHVHLGFFPPGHPGQFEL